jgi:hypothetical protein
MYTLVPSPKSNVDYHCRYRCYHDLPTLHSTITIIIVIIIVTTKKYLIKITIITVVISFHLSHSLPLLFTASRNPPADFPFLAPFAFFFLANMRPMYLRRGIRDVFVCTRCCTAGQGTGWVISYLCLRSLSSWRFAKPHEIVSL